MSCKECCKYSGCMERDRDYHCREFKRKKLKKIIHKPAKISGGKHHENKRKTRGI